MRRSKFGSHGGNTAGSCSQPRPPNLLALKATIEAVRAGESVRVKQEMERFLATMRAA